MHTATTASDVSGTILEIGDTVVAVNGQSTGRICEITCEDDTSFICVRPVHQSYGKGIWYAADQVFWVARPAAAKAKESASAQPPASSGKPTSGPRKTAPTAALPTSRKK
ncbi:MAG: hypothetical protein AAGG38_09010 [Planctomycetota bacterium]